MLFQEGLSQQEIEQELCHDITGKNNPITLASRYIPFTNSVLHKRSLLYIYIYIVVRLQIAYKRLILITTRVVVLLCSTPVLF